MNVPIQDCIFLHTGQRGVGGPYCAPADFDWQAVPTGAPARFYVDGCMRDAPNHPHPRVGWLVEVPPFRQGEYDWAVAHEREFDCILTPCKEYALRGGPWRWYPRGGSMLKSSEWAESHKLRRVSMLASNKTDATGHKLRHEIYTRYGHRLEMFGSIVSRRHEPKLPALAPYRYSIVVDAERNAGCFCDHILDALATYTAPIYWGCPDIGEWLNADGIIQFERIDELGAILDSLSPEDYERRRYAVVNNAQAAWKYRVPEDWLLAAYPDLFEGLE